MELSEFLQKTTSLFETVFGPELVGLYLHGSAAMGCFNPAKSDIDLLCVVLTPPEPAAKEQLMQGLFALHSLCRSGEEKALPQKGVEMSIVTLESCRSFAYNTPFELHFSISHEKSYIADPQGYCARMNGTDTDLAAHFYMIINRSVTLSGACPAEVFGRLESRYFVRSLLEDSRYAVEQLKENAGYAVLNHCRFLAFLTDGSVLSKAEGAAWALEHLPASWHGIISAAAEWYAGDGAERLSGVTEAAGFCGYASGAIFRKLKQR